jgi:drug/metabolite transporter (DMT)-like permease
MTGQNIFYAYSASPLLNSSICFDTIQPFGFYFEGINLIRSTPASITATLEPITAGVLSFLFLKEILGVWQILGGVLVLVSIVMLQHSQEIDENASGQFEPKASKYPCAVTSL